MFESAAISFAATAIFLLIGEIVVRLVIHAPLLEIHDFRHERAARTINHYVQYDSVLGWQMKPHLTSLAFNTLDYGFRSSGGPDVEVRSGGVLAIGSSFTAGAEVADGQTWPAQLGQISGWNVNNAGEGNYVADQIIMRGEQFLPIIRPQTIVVDLITDNIVGAAYSSYGWPKPYFTVQNGVLVRHNVPVPRIPDPGHDRFGIKPFLGHIAIVDQFMAAFFSDSWFTSDGSSYVTIDNDPVDVTCRLLTRLKRETDEANVRLVLYLQSAGLYVIRSPDEPPQSTGVAKCAREMQITTIDEFATLRGLYEKSPNEFRQYYNIEPNGEIGHKSPLGNLQAAKALQAVIRGFEIPVDQKSK